MSTAERFLVTGCAGFIGSQVAERLLGEGHAVVGADCLTDFYCESRKRANLERLHEHDAFELSGADLATDPLDATLDGVSTVLHLAGQPGVRQSFDDSAVYVRNNVLAGRRLLAACALRPLDAFVYASSSSVYGDCGAAGPMREDHPTSPVSPYARTKVALEGLARRAWREHAVPVVGLRYFSVYGPRQRPDMAFQGFIERALAGRPLTVLGDGSQARDFTFVDDAVDATLAAARRGRRGGVYNVGGGRPVTLNAVIDLLAQLLERSIEVERLPGARGDVRVTRADAGRARAELGFEARRGLADGLALQLEAALAASPLRAAA